MTESKPNFGSNFAKVDAHQITAEEYDEIPELTAEWFETADMHEGKQLVRRGRPKSAAPKMRVTLRIDSDVLEAFRKTGDGWQTRINDALRKAIA